MAAGRASLKARQFVARLRGDMTKAAQGFLANATAATTSRDDRHNAFDNAARLEMTLVLFDLLHRILNARYGHDTIRPFYTTDMKSRFDKAKLHWRRSNGYPPHTQHAVETAMGHFGWRTGDVVDADLDTTIGHLVNAIALVSPVGVLPAAQVAAFRKHVETHGDTLSNALVRDPSETVVKGTGKPIAPPAPTATFEGVNPLAAAARPSGTPPRRPRETPPGSGSSTGSRRSLLQASPGGVGEGETATPSPLKAAGLSTGSSAAGVTGMARRSSMHRTAHRPRRVRRPGEEGGIELSYVKPDVQEWNGDRPGDDDDSPRAMAAAAAAPAPAPAEPEDVAVVAVAEAPRVEVTTSDLQALVASTDLVVGTVAEVARRCTGARPGRFGWHAPVEPDEADVAALTAAATTVSQLVRAQAERLLPAPAVADEAVAGAAAPTVVPGPAALDEAYAIVAGVASSLAGPAETAKRATTRRGGLLDRLQAFIASYADGEAQPAHCAVVQLQALEAVVTSGEPVAFPQRCRDVVSQLQRNGIILPNRTEEHWETLKGLLTDIQALAKEETKERNNTGYYLAGGALFLAAGYFATGAVGCYATQSFEIWPYSDCFPGGGSTPGEPNVTYTVTPGVVNGTDSALPLTITGGYGVHASMGDPAVSLCWAQLDGATDFGAVPAGLWRTHASSVACWPDVDSGLPAVCTNGTLSRVVAAARPLAVHYVDSRFPNGTFVDFHQCLTGPDSIAHAARAAAIGRNVLLPPIAPSTGPLPSVQPVAPSISPVAPSQSPVPPSQSPQPPNATASASPIRTPSPPPSASPEPYALQVIVVNNVTGTASVIPLASPFAWSLMQGNVSVNPAEFNVQCYTDPRGVWSTDGTRTFPVAADQVAFPQPPAGSHVFSTREGRFSNASADTMIPLLFTTGADGTLTIRCRGIRDSFISPWLVSAYASILQPSPGPTPSPAPPSPGVNVSFSVHVDTQGYGSGLASAWPFNSTMVRVIGNNTNATNPWATVQCYGGGDAISWDYGAAPSGVSPLDPALMVPPAPPASAAAFGTGLLPFSNATSLATQMRAIFSVGFTPGSTGPIMCRAVFNTNIGEWLIWGRFMREAPPSVSPLPSISSTPTPPLPSPNASASVTPSQVPPSPSGSPSQAPVEFFIRQRGGANITARGAVARAFQGLLWEAERAGVIIDPLAQVQCYVNGSQVTMLVNGTGGLAGLIDPSSLPSPLPPAGVDAIAIRPNATMQFSSAVTALGGVDVSVVGEADDTGSISFSCRALVRLNETGRAWGDAATLHWAFPSASPMPSITPTPSVTATPVAILLRVNGSAVSLGADAGASVRPLAPEASFSLNATQGGVVVFPALGAAFFSRDGAMAIAVPAVWSPYFVNITDACGSGVAGIAMASLPWMNATEAMSAVDVSAASDAAFPEGAMRQLEGCFGLNGGGYGAAMVVSNVTRDTAPQQEFPVAKKATPTGSVGIAGFFLFPGLDWEAEIGGVPNNPNVRIAFCMDNGEVAIIPDSLGAHFTSVSSTTLPSGEPPSCDRFYVGPISGTAAFNTIVSRMGTVKGRLASSGSLGIVDVACVAFEPGKEDQSDWGVCASVTRD